VLVPGPFPKLPPQAPLTLEEWGMMLAMIGVSLLVFAFFLRKEGRRERITVALEEIERFLLDPYAELRKQFEPLEQRERERINAQR